LLGPEPVDHRFDLRYGGTSGRVVDRCLAVALGLGQRLVQRNGTHHLEPGAPPDHLDVVVALHAVGDRDHARPPVEVCETGEPTGREQRLGGGVHDDQQGTGIAPPAHERLTCATGEIADDAPRVVRELAGDLAEGELRAHQAASVASHLAELQEADVVRPHGRVVLYGSHGVEIGSKSVARPLLALRLLLDGLVGDRSVGDVEPQREGEAGHRVGVEGEDGLAPAGEHSGERARDRRLAGPALTHKGDSHGVTRYREFHRPAGARYRRQARRVTSTVTSSASARPPW
jgi:hypothetical protein